MRKVADLSSDAVSRSVDTDQELACITGMHCRIHHIPPSTPPLANLSSSIMCLSLSVLSRIDATSWNHNMNADDADIMLVKQLRLSLAESSGSHGKRTTRGLGYPETNTERRTQKPTSEMEERESASSASQEEM